MRDLRRDPIVGRWVILCTERARRPAPRHRGAPASPRPGPCPFCGGQEQKTPPEILAYRSDPWDTVSMSNGGGGAKGGQPDSAGWMVRVFPNKYPALRVEGSLDREGEGLYDRMSGVGAHEVIVETPVHELSLQTLHDGDIALVLWAYRDRIIDLKRDQRLRYILLFKNHGAAAGASVEHAHSQLIALPFIPKVVAEELQGAEAYYKLKERCVFCDVVRQEVQDRKRIVLESETFVAFAPFASRAPFEVWIAPRAHSAAFEERGESEIKELARLLRTVLRKLDAALETPAFNFMLHTAPSDVEPCRPFYHWHLEIMPTVTQVAGFEWGSGAFINPVAPEEAAEFLRQVPA